MGQDRDKQQIVFEKKKANVGKVARRKQAEMLLLQSQILELIKVMDVYLGSKRNNGKGKDLGKGGEV